MTQPVGSASSRSYGVGSSTSTFRGRIESIDDPENRNRVQVRIFGYQDDQSGVPKEKLEWMHVTQHDSQIAGATSTQPYYPGSEIMIMQAGSERFVMGALPGFDSENKLQNNPWSADNSGNKKPDVPNKQRKEKGESTIRSSPGLVQGAKGLTSYFSYNNWNGLVKKIFPYAIGKGEKPAPFGNGTPAKLDELKSIGLEKFMGGSDILNVIKSLDNNISGAIQPAIDMIRNFRNNGFGSATSTIGGGLLNTADNSYNDKYGMGMQYDILSILQQLIIAITTIKSLTSSNIYTKSVSGEMFSTFSIFYSTTLNVSISLVDDMNVVIEEIITSNNNGNTSYYLEKLSTIQSTFKSLLSQSITAIFSLFTTAATQFNSLEDFIIAFGGSETFISLTNSLVIIAEFGGIQKVSIINLGCFGAFSAVFNNNLPAFNNSTNQNNGNGGGSGGRGGGGGNSMGAQFSKFLGNPTALKELMGGGKVPDSLSGIKLLYEGAKDPQHPNNKFKPFPAKGK